ncbi:hypothetical protein BH09SUM1_BH09SUM1_10090 [soil metagenome]
MGYIVTCFNGQPKSGKEGGKAREKEGNGEWGIGNGEPFPSSLRSIKPVLFIIAVASNRQNPYSPFPIPHSRTTPAPLNIEEYERMYEMEDTYWWFQGRMRIVESMLAGFMKAEPRPGRVLDVGCGTGLMLERLHRWEPIGLDFSPLALDFSRRRGVKNLVRGDVVKLPFQDNSIDLIMALDLIEHIERDDLMAAEFFRVLRPGGVLMATVPAHQSLWSDHDIALHHFRRYSYSGFKSLLQNVGFKPVKYSYGISFTYLPIVIFRKLQLFWQRSTGIHGPARPKTHLIPLPWFINKPLIGVLHVEAVLLKKMNLPIGVSLMTLCEKPAESAMGLP